jgi:hypothetical protein
MKFLMAITKMIMSSWRSAEEDHFPDRPCNLNKGGEGSPERKGGPSHGAGELEDQSKAKTQRVESIQAKLLESGGHEGV